MKTAADIFKRKGRNNVVIGPDAIVLDALRIMAEKNIGSIIVMDDDKYRGLFTERDYARKVILHGKSSSELQVGEIMSEYLPQVTPSHSLDDCMEIMSNHNIRYLPVFENEEFFGVLSVIDVVKETMLAQRETIEHLQQYINS
jgi:CBS domain-containing protein